MEISWQKWHLSILRLSTSSNVQIKIQLWVRVIGSMEFFKQITRNILKACQYLSDFCTGVLVTECILCLSTTPTRRVVFTHMTSSLERIKVIQPLLLLPSIIALASMVQIWRLVTRWSHFLRQWYLFPPIALTAKTALLQQEREVLRPLRKQPTKQLLVID